MLVGAELVSALGAAVRYQASRCNKAMPLDGQLSVACAGSAGGDKLRPYDGGQMPVVVGAA